MKRRLTLLDEAERDAGKKSPSLEILIEAMIRPTVEGGFAAGRRDTTFMRLMARCHSEPNPEIEHLIRAQFQRIMARFTDAFARALPELPREELFWRLIFTFGSLLHALLISSKENSLPGGQPERLDADGLIQRLVAFASAGMKASIQEGR